MAYWVSSDYSGYYIGDKQQSTDIEVTKRPYPTCYWDGSAWVYDLAETRIRSKATYNSDLNTDIISLISNESNPSSFFIGMMYLALFADAVSYADNSANNSPFYDGYLAVSGLANKAAVNTAIKNNYDIFGGVLGRLAAQRDIDYALIDAATTGPDIVAIVYVRPF